LSLSLRPPHQNPVHSSILTHTRHMPRPSHSSRFYHPHTQHYTIIFILLSMLTHTCGRQKKILTIPDAAYTILWAPDDGRKNRQKRAERWK
jgi:hypothetical protein